MGLDGWKRERVRVRVRVRGAWVWNPGCADAWVIP